MRTYEGEELVLDESEYAVDVDDTTTSYTSEESGIRSQVRGRLYSHSEHWRRSSGQAKPPERMKKFRQECLDHALSIAPFECF